MIHESEVYRSLQKPSSNPRLGPSDFFGGEACIVNLDGPVAWAQKEAHELRLTNPLLRLTSLSQNFRFGLLLLHLAGVIHHYGVKNQTSTLRGLPLVLPTSHFNTFFSHLSLVLPTFTLQKCCPPLLRLRVDRPAGRRLVVGYPCSRVGRDQSHGFPEPSGGWACLVSVSPS